MIENITRDDIDVHVKAENWEDAIKKSSEYLLKTGKITEEYIDSMIEAVHRVGPYIVLGHSVALAHARPECGVNELAVHFTTLDPPVPFGSEQFDPVSLLITLAAIDADSHLELMSELAGILMDTENVDRLSECDSKDEFLENLQRMAMEE